MTSRCYGLALIGPILAAICERHLQVVRAAAQLIGYGALLGAIRRSCMKFLLGILRVSRSIVSRAFF